MLALPPAGQSSALQCSTSALTGALSHWGTLEIGWSEEAKKGRSFEFNKEPIYQM